MKKYILIFTLFISFIFITICVSANQSSQPINTLPMYGNLEKTLYQKQHDQDFIQSVIDKTGSREKGSEKYANIGWSYLSKGDWQTAMKRFNQAWLLNPQNPQAYWGFGSILNQQRKFDEAIKMSEKALQLDPQNYRLMSDLAFTYGNKARTVIEFNEEKARYVSKAIALYRKASNSNPEYSGLYFQWAVTLFYNNNYEEAWEQVQKAEKSGFNVPAPFIAELASKMPRPKNN